MTITVADLKAQLEHLADDTSVIIHVRDQDADLMEYSDPIMFMTKDNKFYLLSKNGSLVEENEI
jgi:hypothetical protein